jgi:serine protease Do
MLCLLAPTARGAERADMQEIDALHDLLGEPPRLTALGLQFEPITPELRALYGLEEEADGLVVTEVEEESRAADQGVQAGDILLVAGMEKVTSLPELADRIAALRRAGDKSILLLLEQDGDTAFVDLPLTARK